MAEPIMPTRLAMIREAVASTAADYPKPRPVVHRAELLAEVDRLTAERDEAVRDLASYEDERHGLVAELDRMRLAGACWFRHCMDARREVRSIESHRDELQYGRDQSAQAARDLAVELDAARAELAGLQQRVTEVADMLESAATGRLLNGLERAVLSGLPGRIRAAVRGGPIGDLLATGGTIDADTARRIGQALTTGQVGCLLTPDDQMECWPDCQPCQGAGRIGHCSTCDGMGTVQRAGLPGEGVATTDDECQDCEGSGLAHHCETCGGMGKIRPATPSRLCPSCDRTRDGLPGPGCRYLDDHVLPADPATGGPSDG